MICRTSSLLSEESRLGSFANSDQIKWRQRSKQVINDIILMINRHATFKEIYEFARGERATMASELKHNNASDFGRIREIVGIDDYEPGLLSSTEPMNLHVFQVIQETIATQKNKFTRTPVNNIPTLKHFGKSDKDHQFYFNDTKAPIGMMNLYFFSEHDLLRNIETIRIASTTYPLMNVAIYKKCLCEFEVYFRKLLAPLPNEDEMLFRLGTYAYALSRIVLLRRGTAAVNGWILNAVLLSKGYELNHLNIHGIPFDIYAQVQLDGVKFANEFAKTINPNFQARGEYAERFNIDFFEAVVSEGIERLILMERIKDVLVIFENHKININQQRFFVSPSANKAITEAHLQLEILQNVNIDTLSNAALKEQFQDILAPLCSDKTCGGRRLQYALHKHWNKLHQPPLPKIAT